MQKICKNCDSYTTKNKNPLYELTRGLVLHIGGEEYGWCTDTDEDENPTTIATATCDKWSGVLKKVW